MKVVTSEEMRDIDSMTIKSIGISGVVLMERAGAAAAAKIKELFPKGKVVILAGGGNNGGDGLVAARELFNAGWDARVLLLIRQDKLSPDCLLQYRIIKQMGIPIEFRTDISDKDIDCSVIVDALLGTGLNKDIEGVIAKAINLVNKAGSKVLSIDMPSGISSDTGRVMGVAVKADFTITFGLPKRGHFLYPGASFSGKLFIENIGFPEGLLISEDLKVNLMDERQAASLIPARPKYSHKGDYGHALIVAGSRGKTGAALLAARACLRAGAGLVTIGVPESLITPLQSRATEEMTLPLPDRGDGTLSSKAADHILRYLTEKADVICIGPGIGVTPDTIKLLSDILASSKIPLVIDADGLNSITYPGLMMKASAPVIITPHIGEMARLLLASAGKGQALKELSRAPNPQLLTRIEHDRVNAALSFSKNNEVYVVLKGAPTIIAEPSGRAFINTTGNPGMATAGAGDVLSGIISSFAGQGLNPLNASMLGVYMHGLAGDIAAGEKGEHSLIAGDIIDCLPSAFNKIQGRS